jgi:hypothetical protein
MRILPVLLLTGLLCAIAQPVSADDLPLGNWTGSARRLDGNNQNRPARILVVKKVADPHVLWRGGSGEMTSVSFGANQNTMAEVSSITLNDGRLIFTYTQSNLDSVAKCELVLQPKEGTYVGDCTGDGNWRVTLTPPAPAPAKPAEAKPAEAK